MLLTYLIPSIKTFTLHCIAPETNNEGVKLSIKLLQLCVVCLFDSTNKWSYLTSLTQMVQALNQIIAIVGWWLGGCVGGWVGLVVGGCLMGY